MKEMTSKKLPIGIQSFSKLRQDGYLYVDKTELVYKLVSDTNAFFLSRPRRFGKSLLLSTIEAIFSGQRDLFKGLWIENQWDWSKTYPIIRFSFDNIGMRELGLEHALERRIEQIAESYKIHLVEKGVAPTFKELIIKLTAQAGRVVILIDEYDKPIIEHMEPGDMSKAYESRKILKSFFSVLKSADEYIQFLFITGVSKFSQVSIFSDLNHLSAFAAIPLSETMAPIVDMMRFFEKNDIKNVIDRLHSLFRSIPSQIFIGNEEKYYHSIVHIAFTLLNAWTDSEVNSSNGRLDTVVKLPNRIFIFEFKLSQTAEEAFQQIIEKDYAAQYRLLNLPITGIGVAFGQKEKGVIGWKAQEI